MDMEFSRKKLGDDLPAQKFDLASLDKHPDDKIIVSNHGTKVSLKENKPFRGIAVLYMNVGHASALQTKQFFELAKEITSIPILKDSNYEIIYIPIKDGDTRFEIHKI